MSIVDLYLIRGCVWRGRGKGVSASKPQQSAKITLNIWAIILLVFKMNFGGLEMERSLRYVSFCTFFIALTSLAITVDASNCSHQIKKVCNIAEEIFFPSFQFGITYRDMNDTYTTRQM